MTGSHGLPGKNDDWTCNQLVDKKCNQILPRSLTASPACAFQSSPKTWSKGKRSRRLVMKLGRFLNIFSLRNSFGCFVCCLLKLYLSLWAFCLHACLCTSCKRVACRSQKCWRFVQGIGEDICSLAYVTSWTPYMWRWKQWREFSGWSILDVQTWWQPESESSEPMLFIYLLKSQMW